MSRRRWSRLLLGTLGTWLIPTFLLAGTTGSSTFAGSLKWARLKTASPSWDRHARADSRMLRFIRENTSLEIEPRWYAADVQKLDQMCGFPFLFSEGLHHVTDPTGLANLREYFKRHGFIFIDACINTRDVNPDPDAFLQKEIETLQCLLPDATIKRLPDDHEIFHLWFPMKDGLPHTYVDDRYNPAWARHGLYAVYSDHRLVSLISLSGLQCGWDWAHHPHDHTVSCEKMMLNIYAYVAMRS